MSDLVRRTSLVRSGEAVLPQVHVRHAAQDDLLAANEARIYDVPPHLDLKHRNNDLNLFQNRVLG